MFFFGTHMRHTRLYPLNLGVTDVEVVEVEVVVVIADEGSLTTSDSTAAWRHTTVASFFGGVDVRAPTIGGMTQKR